MQPGHYLIVSDSEVQVNNEPFVTRATSVLPDTPGVQAFRRAVRKRDKRCVCFGLDVFKIAGTVLDRQVLSGLHWCKCPAVFVGRSASDTR